MVFYGFLIILLGSYYHVYHYKDSMKSLLG